ncbi:NAD(P)/FAD-dependent oxidoreductase [Actinotalea sp. Marseille-Q4924]|uniref:flavin-containing monooxygenase n=1 Tax=Actinotalea sp. Marseille-Q4924 TaxID=2866571 RepID=UPI001CE3EF19|nr:NAD(P)-binding domain-containing protein [Actinotalea sp. Marseille-Q4924]
METTQTVVIGAGQAGLSVGYHLTRRGRPFVILDAGRRVGDSWRSHWSTLRLYSPAGYDGLPGMRFPAPPFSFPAKDDVADYLEEYAERFRLPVRSGTRVRRLSRDGDRYVVDCSVDGRDDRRDLRVECENVVVATGTFGRTPSVPDFAADLDAGVLQLHSSQYRDPSQLRPGRVLVVGASHSGGDIALEAAQSHPTVLCGRDTGQIPLPWESRRLRVAMPVLWFVWGHVLSTRTPMGRKEREAARHHGAPFTRVKRADLAAAGVERVTERMTGIHDGMPVLGDSRVLEVENVVWCTGFQQDLSWIDLPVTGPDGWPLEHRGVVRSQPGLYFTGLSFQSSFRSMLIGGAGADAQYVVRHLTSRSPASAQAESLSGAAGAR